MLTVGQLRDAVSPLRGDAEVRVVVRRVGAKESESGAYELMYSSASCSVDAVAARPAAPNGEFVLEVQLTRGSDPPPTSSKGGELYAAVFPDGSCPFSSADRHAVENYVAMATVDGCPAPQLVTFVPQSHAATERDETRDVLVCGIGIGGLKQWLPYSPKTEAEYPLAERMVPHSDLLAAERRGELTDDQIEQLANIVHDCAIHDTGRDYMALAIRNFVNGCGRLNRNKLSEAESRVRELVAIAEQDAIDMASERAAFVQLRKALEESNERLRNYAKTLEPLAAAYREMGEATLRRKAIDWEKTSDLSLVAAEGESMRRMLDRAAEHAKGTNQG